MLDASNEVTFFVGLRGHKVPRAPAVWLVTVLVVFRRSPPPLVVGKGKTAVTCAHENRGATGRPGERSCTLSDLIAK